MIYNLYFKVLKAWLVGLVGCYKQQKGGQLKIFINFCETDPKEDEAVGQIIELLRDAMPTFEMTMWDNLPNKRGKKTHSCYFLFDGHHYEL